MRQDNLVTLPQFTNSFISEYGIPCKSHNNLSSMADYFKHETKSKRLYENHNFGYPMFVNHDSDNAHLHHGHGIVGVFSVTR